MTKQNIEVGSSGILFLKQVKEVSAMSSKCGPIWNYIHQLENRLAKLL